MRPLPVPLFETMFRRGGLGGGVFGSMCSGARTFCPHPGPQTSGPQPKQLKTKRPLNDFLLLPPNPSLLKRGRALLGARVSCPHMGREASSLAAIRQKAFDSKNKRTKVVIGTNLSRTKCPWTGVRTECPRSLPALLKRLASFAHSKKSWVTFKNGSLDLARELPAP